MVETERMKLERYLELLEKDIGSCNASRAMELIRSIEKNKTCNIDDSVRISMLITKFSHSCKCEPK